MTLPALLSELRGSRSVVDVASDLGVSTSTVYGWESEYGTPQYRRIEGRTLRALLSLYEVHESHPHHRQVWDLYWDAPPSGQAASA